MSKSFLCDSREKYKEGSEPTVRKVDNQEAGNNSEIKHKKNRGQRQPRPQSIQETAFQSNYNI